MKKVFLFLAVALSLFSCKKEGCASLDGTAWMNSNDHICQFEDGCLYYINDGVVYDKYMYYCSGDTTFLDDGTFSVVKFQNGNLFEFKYGRMRALKPAEFVSVKKLKFYDDIAPVDTATLDYAIADTAVAY